MQSYVKNRANSDIIFKFGTFQYKLKFKLIRNYHKMKKSVIFISVFLLFASILDAQGYQIGIKFKNLANDTVIMGHNFAGGQLIPDDTVVTNKQGYAVFKGKEKLPGGMYFLFFSNKNKFDFLLSDNQKFEIQGDTADLVKSLKFKGDNENAVFADYQKFRAEIWEKNNALKKERHIADSLGNKKRIKEIDAEYKTINQEAKEKMQKIIADNKGSFMADFLLAAQDVHVPKDITDGQKQYEYYRYHYFDNFNISDPRLLRTPIYENKIDTYIDKLIPQHPDSLIEQVDMLIEKSRTNDELFRYMLVHLFNKYAASQVVTSENVYVHIAQKYYIPEATWSDKEFIDELKEKADRKEKCLVGGIAKNISFRYLQSDSTIINKYKTELKNLKKEGHKLDKSKVNEQVKYDARVNALNAYYQTFNPQNNLYNSKAKYTILWFWTPDCSHCRKETPIFYKDYIEKNFAKEDVQIIAIYMNKTDLKGDWDKFCDITDRWLDFVKEHELYNWQNVWNPFDPYRINYDINSSPVLYILDKDKKIVTKRIGYEQALELVEKALKDDKKRK